MKASTTSERRAELVDLAIPVFLRFGYKKTAMDAVADAAGISRQALYLHFPSKALLFGAVVDRLCERTIESTHAALWRPDYTLAEQLLAAFEDVLPQDSLPLLAELLATARILVPDAVANIDKLVVGEIADRLRVALGGKTWPVPNSDEVDAARILQAASYGLKDQTSGTAEYLGGMRHAINTVLAAGGLASAGSPPTNERRRNKP
jgi:AcrR family transcriptional regulator